MLKRLFETLKWKEKKNSQQITKDIKNVFYMIEKWKFSPKFSNKKSPLDKKGDWKKVQL